MDFVQAPFQLWGMKFLLSSLILSALTSKILAASSKFCSLTYSLQSRRSPVMLLKTNTIFIQLEFVSSCPHFSTWHQKLMKCPIWAQPTHRGVQKVSHFDSSCLPFKFDTGLWGKMRSKSKGQSMVWAQRRKTLQAVSHAFYPIPFLLWWTRPELHAKYSLGLQAWAQNDGANQNFQPFHVKPQCHTRIFTWK